MQQDCSHAKNPFWTIGNKLDVVNGRCQCNSWWCKTNQCLSKSSDLTIIWGGLSTINLMTSSGMILNGFTFLLISFRHRPEVSKHVFMSFKYRPSNNFKGTKALSPVHQTSLNRKRNSRDPKYYCMTIACVWVHFCCLRRFSVNFFFVLQVCKHLDLTRKYHTFVVDSVCTEYVFGLQGEASYIRERTLLTLLLWKIQRRDLALEISKKKKK